MLFGAHEHHNPVSSLVPRYTSGTKTHQLAPAPQSRKPCRPKHGFLSLSRVQGGSACAGCKGKLLAMREAKGRLGPGNLEGEARKYAGPYPRAAKGECAGETGESGAKTRNTAQASAQGGAKMQDDHAELRISA